MALFALQREPPLARQAENVQRGRTDSRDQVRPCEAWRCIDVWGSDRCPVLYLEGGKGQLGEMASLSFCQNIRKHGHVNPTDEVVKWLLFSQELAK